jgi:hypothetical protein
MACEPDQKPAIKTELKVNAQDIQLNNFVQDFMGLAVTGMIKSLKGERLFKSG